MSLVLEAARENATIVPAEALHRSTAGEIMSARCSSASSRCSRDAIRRLEGENRVGREADRAEPGALENAFAEDDPEEPDHVSPGVAYMKSRGREAKEREEIDALANSWAAEAHDRLADAAVEALLNPLQKTPR